MDGFNSERLFDVQRQMAAHVFGTTTPLSEFDGSSGFALGTGNYVAIGGRVVIITNEHVIQGAVGAHLAYLAEPGGEYLACG